MKGFTARFLVFYLWVCTSNYSYIDAAIIGRAATIFGFGATRNDESSQQDDQPRLGGPSLQKPPPPLPNGLPQIHPPPPPPPPAQFTGVNTLGDLDEALGYQTQNSEDVNMFSQQPPTTSLPKTTPQNPGHVLQPPRHIPFKQQNRGNGLGRPLQPPNYVIQGMQHDLEIAFQREQGLRAHVANITAQLAHMQQREDLHVRQLDVLTERVIETEATMAKERNDLLQYQNNCTEMGKQIAILEGSVEEWRQKCSEHVEQVARLRNESEALGSKLTKMTLKAEELSTLVERHRIADQDEESTTSHHLRKSRKKRGFFAWLFGWGSIVDPVDESLESLREEARSTLLAALQRERENVEELEATVTNLQRNNTALAEQVKSRDEIMDELNDRIGVFEEDRVVLKAALRQLKKDMSEEAPKTQRMAEDLKFARVEIERLQNEIESLLLCHDEEIANLQSTIREKEDAIQMTESNLTMIGTYVRKLEERLGDFAVARREIETREQECLEMELNAKKVSENRKLLEDEVVSLQKEHEEFRELIEELIQARSKLKLENDHMRNERDMIKRTQSQLEHNVNELKKQIATLQDENGFLSTQYFSLEQAYNTTQGNLARVEGQSVANEEFQALVQKLKSLEDSKENLEAQLSTIQEDKQAISQQADSAISALQSKENELLQLQNALDNFTSTNARERESLLQEIQRTTSQLRQAEEKAAQLEKDLNVAKQKEVSLLDKVEAARASSMKNASSTNQDALQPKMPHLLQNYMSGQSEQKPEAINKPRNATNVLPRQAETNKGGKSQQKQDPSSQRNVPLRKLRKAFSKLTGVHGLVTKPSRSSTNALVQSSKQNSFHRPLPSLHNITSTNSTKGQRQPSFLVGISNATRPDSPSVKNRKVPLRSLRKFSSKITGVHGLFTQPSKPRQPDSRASLQGRQQTGSEKRSPSPSKGKPSTKDAQTDIPVFLRPELLPKHPVEYDRKSQSIPPESK
ncbi:hypothetical protein FisN_12Lh128 [Fistulifera solaris]|uniref:Rhodanese domain-containing protein n=1 Tax=Fistulifera solaris TaxID=1519565 RepID=A0A1Z5JN05_FISSO|nr:hypothetical protein FisN_12Lh128 [Fistulifera solaris]|eukprot:GAX15168.1 hypothetical protein FisN_12Lh128 [Fistulifera solaris]